MHKEDVNVKYLPIFLFGGLLMFGPHNKLGVVGILFYAVLYVTSVFFMIFHFIRYYFRQEEVRGD